MRAWSTGAAATRRDRAHRRRREGVGSAAVQIAAAIGARPLGVASPPNRDYWRAWAPARSSTTTPSAGPSRCGRVIFLVLQSTPAQLERGITGESFAAHVDRARLEQLDRLVDPGQLRRQVGAVLPLEQVREALAQIAGRRHRPAGTRTPGQVRTRRARLLTRIPLTPPSPLRRPGRRARPGRSSSDGGSEELPEFRDAARSSLASRSSSSPTRPASAAFCTASMVMSWPCSAISASRAASSGLAVTDHHHLGRPTAIKTTPGPATRNHHRRQPRYALTQILRPRRDLNAYVTPSTGSGLGASWVVVMVRPLQMNQASPAQPSTTAVLPCVHRSRTDDLCVNTQQTSRFVRRSESAISADCNWLITDCSLQSVAITYPRPNQAVNHRSGREARGISVWQPQSAMAGCASSRAIPRSALCAGHYARLRSWDDARQCAWHGPWHGTLDNPSTASAVSAIPCVIGAGSADSARGRTYGKKIYGSIP
jgi:hypothetical protein